MIGNLRRLHQIKRSGLFFATSLVCACGVHESAPTTAAAATQSSPLPTLTAATAGNHKPTAPIALTMSNEVTGDGKKIRVTLQATATDDLQNAEVHIDGRVFSLGSMTKGTSQTVSSTVDIGAALSGRSILAGAAVVSYGRRTTTATSMQIGTAAVLAAPAPSTIVTLPDGTIVNEVRP
jgi:hypothetical protein